MDRRQLKNVIIIILLLVNGFLAGSLVSRSTAARTAQSRSAQQLAELFDADGIQLDISTQVGKSHLMYFCATGGTVFLFSLK